MLRKIKINEGNKGNKGTFNKNIICLLVEVLLRICIYLFINFNSNKIK